MNRQEMVNIRFKLVKFSQHVLNDDDQRNYINESSRNGEYSVQIGKILPACIK